MILTLESALCLLLATQACSQGNFNLTCGKETLSAVQAGITQMEMNRTNFSLSFLNRKDANPEKNLAIYQPFCDVVRLILDSEGGAVFAVLYF